MSSIVGVDRLMIAKSLVCDLSNLVLLGSIIDTFEVHATLIDSMQIDIKIWTKIVMIF